MAVRRSVIIFACVCAMLCSLPQRVFAEDGVEHVIAQTQGTPLSAETNVVLTLDKCIELALGENAKLRAAGYGVDAARAQLTEAKAIGWPVVEYEFWTAPVPKNVDTAVSSFFSGDVAAWFKYRFVLGIPITAFGQLSQAQKLAETGIAAARQTVFKERDQLILDVKQIYYGILMGKEMQRLLQRAVDSLSSKIGDEEAAENPSLSPFDQLKMKVFREELTRRLEQVKMEMGIAYEGLKVQLGLDPATPIELDRDVLDPEVVELAKLEEYVNASMDERPESKMIEAGVEAKRQLATLEKFKLAPKLGFGFYFEIGRTHAPISGITATDDFNNPFNFTRAGVGLRLQGTIDFHGAYARIKRTDAEYLKALYEGRIGKEGLKLDARKAFDKAVQLHASVISAKKSQSLSNQMMFLSKTNVELGIGEQDDYAEALQLVLANRGLYFKTVFDYNVALADLERKVGYGAYAKLTGRPNIPVYDAFDVGEGFEGSGGDPLTGDSATASDDTTGLITDEATPVEATPQQATSTPGGTNDLIKE